MLLPKLFPFEDPLGKRIKINGLNILLLESLKGRVKRLVQVRIITWGYLSPHTYKNIPEMDKSKDSY
ncbi:hypothetical protein Ct9H90mP29_20330 [bacterium]|nr:MAG: hypothetical protein Ct9H90mP29_20330 [bacterium]